ncbi:MAG: type IX secretion system sortase PorU, partial [Bacteroidetes bacterium]|nr:type IX secretion system sortase PorU [Bacteroidota bacterium]
MKSKIRLILFYSGCFLGLFFNQTTAQTLKNKIVWDFENIRQSTLNQGIIEVEQSSQLPFITLTFFSDLQDVTDFELVPISFKVIPKKGKWAEIEPSQTFKTKLGERIIAKKTQEILTICPVRTNQFGQLELLTEYQINPTFKARINPNVARKRSSKINSKLNSGSWHKIKVTESGSYLINRAFLSENGINPDNVNASQISIFGYGGSTLPQILEEDVFDDLIEIPCERKGLSDGKFDDGDYLQFYAEGPKIWNYQKNASHYTCIENPFTDEITYFIGINVSSTKSIISQNSPSGNIVYESESHDYLYSHEEELLTDITKTLKTGQNWFGEELGIYGTLEFNLDAINALLLTDSVSFRSAVAERHIGGGNAIIEVMLNDKTVIAHSIGATTDKDDSPYVYPDTKTIQTKLASSNVKVTYNYSKPNSQANAWINFFELNARVQSNYTGGTLLIRDKKSLGNNGIAKMTINSSMPNVVVWDVTNIHSIKALETETSNGRVSFKYELADEIKTFVVTQKGLGNKPTYAGKVENQNYHGLNHTQGYIVYHKDFEEAAKELQSFHKSTNNISVNILEINNIYNEFSSGNQDLAAIRNMLSYFYHTAQNDEQLPRYLLLLGDASYDYKNRIPDNTNLVPTFQSKNSHHGANVFATDDYFGLLDIGEGSFANTEGLDLAIGRFPVNNREQAMQMVEKIKAYHSPNSMASWQNDIVLIADDEDTNAHIRKSEELYTYISTNHPEYNFKKINFDAYVQEASAGGSRYPDVERRINEIMESGALVVNYIGHGGELGWAHERVLEISDINSWENLDRMPLMVTATCEFTRFDDPGRVSAGELVFLNKKGGAIAMLTTTRVVYISDNENLLDALFKKNMFNFNRYDPPTLG